MLKKLAVVIPTYNEKQNIARLLPAILEKLPGVRIFAVDDNSPDGTAEAVREFAQNNQQVRLIWRDKKEGLASAYFDAFARIIPDETIEYILTMDADFSHHPDDLARLAEYLPDYDLVIGSRYVEGGRIENWNFFRRLVSKYANRYAGIITGVPCADLTSGFVLYSRALLGRILLQNIQSNAYGYQIEMKYFAHKAGAKIKEAPITFRERSSGKSKFGVRTIWEGIIVPWHLRLFK